MIYKIVTILAASLLLVASIVQAGAVAEDVEGNNGRRLKGGKKKFTYYQGVDPGFGVTPPGLKKMKSLKKVKAPKAPKAPKSAKKKKSKKGKGYYYTLPTSSPTSKPSQTPSAAPASPFGPVEAFIAVPTGTSPGLVEVAAESAAENVILGTTRRRLQQQSIASLDVALVINPCDCTALGFPSVDSCTCYTALITGRVTDPNAAVSSLSISLTNGVFQAQVQVAIPDAKVEATPFPLESPSSSPTVDTSSPPTINTSSPPTIDTSGAPTIDTSGAPTIDTSGAPTIDTSSPPTIDGSSPPTIDGSVAPTVGSSGTGCDTGSDTGSESATGTKTSIPFGPVGGNLVTTADQTTAEVTAAIEAATIGVISESLRRRFGNLSRTRELLEAANRKLQDATTGITATVTELELYACICDQIPGAPPNCACYRFVVTGTSPFEATVVDLTVESSIDDGVFAQELTDAGLPNSGTQPEDEFYPAEAPTPSPSESFFPSSNPSAKASF